jgi:radical SAM superfamily enzyme YgiQ (UPF0313 family)
MSIKKLLLVSANRFTSPYPVYPLGISYIKAYLNETMPALKIDIFDFMTGTYDDYNALLSRTQPDYVGISLRNIDDVNIYRKESFISHYKQIIAGTREFAKSVVIIGGSGFSIYPRLLFETLQPDFGIHGEGEVSLNNLINAIDSGLDYSSIDGLIFRKQDQIVYNERKNFFNSPVLHFDTSLLDYYWQSSGMLNIQTKRGCPYHCIYCTYPLIEGSKVRTLDPGQIVKTLTELRFQNNINYVFFTDSVFNISNNFNIELAERLIAADLDIQWGGYFNFTNIDLRLLEKLKQAGLRHIEFGTESLSETMLMNYGKPFTVSDVMNISSICNQLEIDFAHFLILGGYGETEQTLDETFENSTRISRTVFFPFIGMRIYPGTRLQEIAVQEKLIERNNPLLEPVYYVSKYIDIASLKGKAQKTEKQWIFPDEDLSPIMLRMRKRNKKGPLWEYLVK